MFFILKLLCPILLINKISTENISLYQSTYHLFLSPNGQILADGICYAENENEITIVTKTPDELLAYLNIYKLREKVELISKEPAYYHKKLPSLIKDCRTNAGYWSTNFEKIDTYYLDKIKYCILDLISEVPLKSLPFLYDLQVNLNKGCFIGQETCQFLTRNSNKKYRFYTGEKIENTDDIIFEFQNQCIFKKRLDE